MNGWIETDILRPLRIDEIETMVEICTPQHSPTNVRVHNFLCMVLKLHKQSLEHAEEIEKSIYSDYMRRKMYTKRNGQLENCTFISISGPKNYTVFAFSHDIAELRDCLAQTNLIDYSLLPIFLSVEGWHRELLADILAKRNVKAANETFYTGRILAARDALEYHYVIPDDVVLERLKASDVDVINEVWPHRYPGSLEFLKSLVALNDSVGIFSKDSREIRAWAMVNDNFGIGMVHTLPQHRGNGYAKIVVKALAKIVAKFYNLDILVFVLKGNTAAENMFQNLGFSILPMPGGYSWFFTQKSDEK